MSKIDISQQGGVSFTERRPEPTPPATQVEPDGPPPKVLSPEEFKAKRADVSRSMGWGEPVEAIAPAVQPERQPEPVVAPVAPVAPVVPVVTPPEPPVKPLDAKALIRETATAVGREVARAVRPEPPVVVEAPAPAFDLSPEDQGDFDLALFLAEQEPQKYGALPARLLEYFKALYGYQDKWLAENPGKQFEPNEPEHEAWFAAHPAPISGDLLEKARVDREVEKRVSQRMRPLEERITMVDSEKALTAALPAINQTVNVWQHNLVRAVDPELAKLLLTDGKVAMTKENIERLDQTDPVAKAVLDSMCATLNPVIAELERTAVPGARYRLEPDKNEVHRFIDNQRKAIEKDLQKATKEDQLRDGKEWLSLGEMATRERAIWAGRKTQAEKEALVAELHENFWTVTVDDLEDVITDELARQAKAQIEQINSVGKRKYGNGAPEPRRETPPPQPEPVREAAPISRDRSRPPSLSSSSDVVTAPENVRGNVKTAGEERAAVHFK